MSRPRVKSSGGSDTLTYEDSKRLLRDDDPQVRADLAARDDLRPEILFYLAGDESAAVRRQVAGNPSTPGKADLMLARDADLDVRGDLASKVARLLPELSARDQEKAQDLVIETLEVLAEDQETRVRGILAKILKDMSAAPPSVIHRLARDGEEVVACPVLEFSPLLSEEDLIEIIAETGVSAKLTAISRRHGLGQRVSDAIASSDDEGAIASLLSNHSAQIREETLDQLVERADRVAGWHEPLIQRPQLSGKATRKLASFVAHNLLVRLQSRSDLDEDTLRAVGEEFERRLECGDEEPDMEPEPAEEEGDISKRVASLLEAGELDEKVLLEALMTGDRAFVRHALAALAELPIRVVEKIVIGGSAKGQTAIVWRAGLSMTFATQLQLRMGGIPPQQVLRGNARRGFPLSDEDMAWQLELYGSLAG